MAQTLSVRRSSSLSAPSTASRALDTLTRRCLSALEPIEGHYSRKAIRRSALPDADERMALQERRMELADTLAPSDPDEVTRSIASLRAVLPAAPGTEASAQLVRAAYVTVLTRFPMWAVNQVCRRYLDGTLSNGGFAPSPPEMAGHCRSAVAKFQEELGALDAVLSAEVYEDPTPDSIRRAELSEEAIKAAAESRAALVKRVWEDRRHEFGADPSETAKPKETPDQIMARLEAEKGKTVVVGEGLAKKLAEMTEQGA